MDADGFEYLPSTNLRTRITQVKDELFGREQTAEKGLEDTVYKNQTSETTKSNMRLRKSPDGEREERSSRSRQRSWALERASASGRTAQRFFAVGSNAQSALEFFSTVRSIRPLEIQKNIRESQKQSTFEQAHAYESTDRSSTSCTKLFPHVRSQF